MVTQPVTDTADVVGAEAGVILLYLFLGHDAPLIIVLLMRTQSPEP